MNRIEKIIRGTWNIFVVKMTEPDALGNYEKYLAIDEYELQLRKEMLFDEYKVPEEIIENIIQLSNDIGARKESDAHNEDL